MKVSKFIEFLNNLNCVFFTGVPDSQLGPFCDFLCDTYGISRRHLIGANEGNCIAIAAGYHLATGKTPVVYMQNSGLGNGVNPITSLLNEKVYGIPCVFVIGWRGEPGVKDEPQHLFQGEITPLLLESLGIKTIIIDSKSEIKKLQELTTELVDLLREGKSVAFLVKKDAFLCDEKGKYKNAHILTREQVIEKITEIADDDIIVSTTGKASRELFEIREKRRQGHQLDFLTVGSMGHSSSIALGIAMNKPDKRIWCIDGDGAVLMHMGAMAVIGSMKPKNFIHVVINNGAHETVGGMPTVSDKIELCKIAEGCGYTFIRSVAEPNELNIVLKQAEERKQLTFIEIKTSIDSRKNLGRPTRSPVENKIDFMKYLSEEKP